MRADDLVYSGYAGHLLPEEAVDPGERTERIAEARHDLHSSQRVAADVEEVGVGLDVMSSECCAPCVEDVVELPWTERLGPAVHGLDGSFAPVAQNPPCAASGSTSNTQRPR